MLQFRRNSNFTILDMKQHTSKPCTSSPSLGLSFAKHTRVHPLPTMGVEFGKGDASKPYITAKVDWTGSKQKSVSSATIAANTKSNTKSKSKKRLFRRRPHVRRIKVAPAPLSNSDSELSKGDYSRPSIARVDWTGGTPASASSTSSQDINKADQAQYQRSRESTDTLLHSVSPQDISKTDQTQCEISSEITNSSIHSVSSLNISKADPTQQQPSAEYIIYGKDDVTTKREMAERQVKKLEQACMDLRDSLHKQNEAQSPENLQHDMTAEETLLTKQLLTAQRDLLEARTKEQAAEYADIKNTIKFYIEEKRRISRGYSEETLLAIDIPAEFETRKQKAKYLTTHIKALRKDKKSLKKEMSVLFSLKEVKMFEKESKFQDTSV